MISGWRLPLRIARRDAQRARGRSILMLVMIALPVLGVTAADILIQTQDISSTESLDRRLGTEAAAKVSTTGDPTTVQHQSIDPEFGGTASGDGDTFAAPTLRTVLATLGGSRAGLEMTQSEPVATTKKGRTAVSGTEIDLRDPLAAGLFRLTSGRLPANRDEVVVSRTLRDRLASDRVVITGDPDGPDPEGRITRTVVGIVESSSYRNLDVIVGLPGSLLSGIGEERSWLVGGGPVTWNEVEKLNKIGALVLSRAVVERPDAAARAAENEYNGFSSTDQTTVTVAILIGVMSLIEVVLLAGPAFAVGARRQARPLALLAACGGTPQQARRVVLATGVVIGTLGSVAGVVLGIGAARALQPLLQHYNDTWFGPFQVPWLHLVGVVAFGFASAMIAAVVPAWIASRQDVVAVLAGRRGDRKPSSRSPYVGVVLLAVGVGLAWLGARQTSSDGSIPIALSAILCVLGMLFLVPVAVVGVARLGRRLPLALRFAVRDAARHRSRTTPAIAAVAATVAGVVALGIGTSSDEAQNRGSYQPQLAMGTATLGANLEHTTTFSWDAYVDAVRREVPGARTERIHGVVNTDDDSDRDITFSGTDGSSLSPDGYGGSIGTNLLVYDGKVPRVLSALPGFDAATAKKVLDAGGAVVLSGGPREDAETYSGRIKVRAETIRYDEGTGEAEGADKSDVRTTTVPGATFHLASSPPVMGIVAAPVARRLGLSTTDVGLGVDGATISRSAEKGIQEAINALPARGYLYVERGYQADSAAWIIQLVLAGLGAVLMLGGTLTATFLALSDARPDLATLSAVGAAPRTRRAVAAAYALAVGGIGAVLGVLVGFVPGIAITYPLTAGGSGGCFGVGCPGARTYLDVPWLLIGSVVVVLPLLVSGIVWVFARSRLPLVSRLS